MMQRNEFMNGILIGSLASIVVPSRSTAVVTDETNSFAVQDSAYILPPEQTLATDSTNTAVTTLNTNKVTQTPTDEVKIIIPMSKVQQSPLGIQVADIEFRTNRRVYVKSILPSSIGAQYNIQPNYIFVKINNQSAERTDAKGVMQMIVQVKQSNAQNLEFTFRNDSFAQDLQNLSTKGEVTTQVAPNGDTTQRNLDGSVKFGYEETSQEDQNITIQQLVAPKMCRRGATIDDLLEISYVGKILETGAVFDGSAIKIDGNGIPGRGNDVSIFFVLGKQPFGQFPPGWDVGLNGMCVGERRRVIIPPVLAYGAQGVPRRNIPPNATLVYDITLVSLNGLATPQ